MRYTKLAGVLLAVIPLAWLFVLALFAALCRAASYDDVDRTSDDRPRARAAVAGGVRGRSGHLAAPRRSSTGATASSS